MFDTEAEQSDRAGLQRGAASQFWMGEHTRAPTGGMHKVSPIEA